MKNKYYFIDNIKEKIDTQKLAGMIEYDKWINNNTIIINCSPDYSSIPVQIINHKLSHLNNNELFEVIPLQMPYPIMNQVWSMEDKEFQSYEKYLIKWISNYIDSGFQYLFIDSGTIRGLNFKKLETLLKKKLNKDNYKFASLYLEENSVFTPDYYIEKFSNEKNGGLAFWWENFNNPNWNY